MAIVRDTGKPTVDLKSEAEVYLVRHALDRLHRRYIKAADTLRDRGAVSLEWMMRNRSVRIAAVLSIIPEGAETCHLFNKEQVDWAAQACEGLITEYRLGQYVEWDAYISQMITILMPLLDRIRVGWKRPAEIPPEILEQIKAREGGRFWNPNPGDWLVTEGVREDDLDVYMWRSPEFDLVEDFEWVGLKEIAYEDAA